MNIHSATLATNGAETLEADVTEHQEDNESGDELAGMKRKLVNEHTEGKPERKRRVVNYHHVVFVRRSGRRPLWLQGTDASISRSVRSSIFDERGSSAMGHERKWRG